MDGLTNTNPGSATTDGAGQWCVRWQSARGARMRLFCLPHAGGGAATYRSWARYLAPEIELIALRLPGRETRFREEPYTRVDDLIPELMAAIRPWLDRPYAWFGHSVGALIAFEACRAARRLRMPEPARLLVGGNPAPHVPPRNQPATDGSLEDFTAELRKLDGTPAALLDDLAALTPLLPTLRADYAMVESYRCAEEPSLDCRISVFGGREDDSVAVEELNEWNRHSAAGCVVRMVPGGHFFINQSREQLLPTVASDALDALAPR